MKIFFLIAISLFLSSCASMEVSDEKPTASTKGIESEDEVPASKRIYYFQHKLIPQWVFESEGAFYFDIYNRDVERFLLIASEVVNQEFSDEIRVNPILDRNAVSIVFPEPQELANCYFALVRKTASEYSYYTYEKTMPFGSEEFVGVVGGWDSEGNHNNYGPRFYTTEQEFIDDVLGSSQVID